MTNPFPGLLLIEFLTLCNSIVIEPSYLLPTSVLNTFVIVIVRDSVLITHASLNVCSLVFTTH